MEEGGGSAGLVLSEFFFFCFLSNFLGFEFSRGGCILGSER